jgi:transcriptional regulator with XRE-family HTH domain
MQAEIVADYLSKLKTKTGLTYEAIAEKSKRSESSVKNLCLGKSEDPRIDTVAPIVYALGGSMDEMLNPQKSKDELKQTSVIALKDSYEYQAALLKETNELHIENIRSHYEQHHSDLKENYEKRLLDKRELIETKNEHIKTLEKECRHAKIFSWICVSVLVALLIAEVANPNLGWLRF